jgi:hypothetical protein
MAVAAKTITIGRTNAYGLAGGSGIKSLKKRYNRFLTLNSQKKLHKKTINYNYDCIRYEIYVGDSCELL